MIQREAYERKINAQVCEWRRDLEWYRARSARAIAHVKASYFDEVERLGGLHRRLIERFDRLKGAGGENWDQAQASLDLACEQFRRVRAHLAEKLD